MTRRRESDQKRGRPQPGNAKYDGHRHYGQSADQHGPFPRGIHGKMPPDETGREPTTCDASKVGNDIDDHHGEPDLREMQAVLSLQIVGNPKEIEPPDRVNHEFSGRECPSLSVRQKLGPSDLSRRPGSVALDVASFLLRAV